MPRQHHTTPSSQQDASGPDDQLPPAVLAELDRAKDEREERELDETAFAYAQHLAASLMVRHRPESAKAAAIRVTRQVTELALCMRRLEHRRQFCTSDVRLDPSDTEALIGEELLGQAMEIPNGLTTGADQLASRVSSLIEGGYYVGRYFQLLGQALRLARGSYTDTEAASRQHQGTTPSRADPSEGPFSGPKAKLGLDDTCRRVLEALRSAADRNCGMQAKQLRTVLSQSHRQEVSIDSVQRAVKRLRQAGFNIANPRNRSGYWLSE